MRIITCQLCKHELRASNNRQKFCGPYRDKKSCARKADLINKHATLNYGNKRFQLRLKIIKRDNYTCQKCKLANQHRSFFDVDHKDGNPNNNNFNNLWSLCPNCHRLKTIENKDNYIYMLREEPPRGRSA